MPKSRADGRAAAVGAGTGGPCVASSPRSCSSKGPAFTRVMNSNLADTEIGNSTDFCNLCDKTC